MKRVVLLLIMVLLVSICTQGMQEENIQIFFDSDNYSVFIGKNITLKPTIISLGNRKLKWTSSNEDIATVSAKGTVKGISEGVTEITVQVEDNPVISVSCKVSVSIPVKRIKPADKEITLAINTTWKMNVEIEPIDATNKKLEWVSSNESIAVVDGNGVITGLSKGTAKIMIKATDGSDVKNTVSVSVQEFDLVFTNYEPQTAEYEYTSGKYTVKGQVKSGCVSIPDLTRKINWSRRGGKGKNSFEVTPVKPGVDLITVKAGKSTTKIRVYVSSSVLEHEDELYPDPDYFFGLRLGTTYEKSKEILTKRKIYDTSYTIREDKSHTDTMTLTFTTKRKLLDIDAEKIVFYFSSYQKGKRNIEQYRFAGARFDISTEGFKSAMQIIETISQNHGEPKKEVDVTTHISNYTWEWKDMIIYLKKIGNESITVDFKWNPENEL